MAGGQVRRTRKARVFSDNRLYWVLDLAGAEAYSRGRVPLNFSDGMPEIVHLPLVGFAAIITSVMHLHIEERGWFVREVFVLLRALDLLLGFVCALLLGAGALVV